MFTARTEIKGPGLTVSTYDDPERIELHPCQYAAAVRADALAGKLEQRWTGFGPELVETELLDIVSAISGTDLRGGQWKPNVSALRAVMKRWVCRQAHPSNLIAA